MATITAAAGGGNWSAGATWTGGVAPTAADDAVLNAGSGNVTIDAGTTVCRSVNCTGYTGTLTHVLGTTLFIGDGTAGAGNIALKFVAGMTYTLGNATSSAIQYNSTSATVQTIDYAGKSTGNVTINGANQQLQQLSGHTTVGTFTLTTGALDTNGQTCNWNVFSSNNNNLRTLTFGASAINMTGGATIWTVGGIVANLTITTNTAVITCTQGGAIFNAAGINYNGASIVFNGAGTSSLNGGPTFANVTRTGTAVKTDGMNYNASFTVTGNLTLTGNSAINRLFIASNTLGTARTITAASETISNVDFMDIAGAGGGAPFTGTSVGDATGNSGITFDAPTTQTVTMSANKNSSDVTIYTSRVPLPQDDVLFTGVTGGTLTFDMPRIGRNINWTGATGSPIWATSITNQFFGSLTLAAGMTTSGSGGIRFSGRGVHTVTTNGVSLAYAGVGVYGPGGMYTQQDNFVTTGSFDYNFGGWNLNNFNLNSTILTSNVTNPRVLSFGTGTWNLTSAAAGTVWNLNGSGLTLSAANGTIAIATSSANTRTFGGQGQSYGSLTYNLAGSTGGLAITGSNTFRKLNISDGLNSRLTQFATGTTQTVTDTNGFNVFGTPGNLMIIQSTTAATHNLVLPGGVRTANYLDIAFSNATGPANYAGANSVDEGTNSGWIFANAPPVGPTVIAVGRTSRLASLGIASISRL